MPLPSLAPFFSAFAVLFLQPGTLIPVPQNLESQPKLTPLGFGLTTPGPLNLLGAPNPSALTLVHFPKGGHKDLHTRYFFNVKNERMWLEGGR